MMGREANYRNDNIVAIPLRATLQAALLFALRPRHGKTHMRTALTALAAALFAYAAAAQNQEYWGALITSSTGESGGRWVYALSWNYPSAQAAEQAAIRECVKQGGRHCDTPDRGIHWFSTSSAKHTSDMLDIEGISRERCIAVGRARLAPHLFWAYTGNSEAEARHKLRTRGGDPHLETTQCNHQ